MGHRVCWGRSAVGIGIAFLDNSVWDDSTETLASKNAIPVNNPASPAGSLFAIFSLTLAMFLCTLVTAQIEGALLLWADKHTERFLFGFEFPVAWLISFAAVLVILLSPVQLFLLPKMKRSISTNRLIASGLVASPRCLPFSSLPRERWTASALSGRFCQSAALLSLKMLIAPLGLALLHRSTPKQFLGLVTGVWCGAGALGYFVGSEVGTLWSRWPIQRVLVLLTLLPLAGAAVLWFPKPRQVKCARTSAMHQTSTPIHLLT